MDVEGPWMDGKANAYEVLGLSPTCDDASIRVAFRKLAKATHPDMLSGDPQATSTARFISALAAYKILSDPQKRTQYDAYLRLHLKSSTLNCYQSRTQGNSVCGKNSQVNNINEQDIAVEEGEVVLWLRWYRRLVVDMVNRQEIGVGEGFQEYLAGHLQSALKAAYFGPNFDRIDEVPEYFEAEERTEPGVSDILQLVSGRRVFGAVRQVCEGAELLTEGQNRITTNKDSTTSLVDKCSLMAGFTYGKAGNKDAASWDSIRVESQAGAKLRSSEDPDVSAYVDLELHLFGNLVAKATRTPPRQSKYSLTDRCDEISVYLCFDQSISGLHVKEKLTRSSTRSSDITGLEEQANGVLLGIIRGLSTSASGGTCTVHAPDGKRTHTVLQHRTPLVKHIHWYRFSDEIARCECRCSRARLPSSKFWLFEPRCDKHNVGGWYVELFGRVEHAGVASFLRSRRDSIDCNNSGTRNKVSSVPADWAGKDLGLLHPAMYIMTAAYKTLDAEVEQTKKKSLVSAIKGQPSLYAAAFSALVWCKGKLPFLK